MYEKVYTLLRPLSWQYVEYRSVVNELFITDLTRTRTPFAMYEKVYTFLRPLSWQSVEYRSVMGSSLITDLYCVNPIQNFRFFGNKPY